VTPGTFEFCTRIIRVCINIFMEIAVEWNIQISNISTLKRFHLQFTTWCVVPYDIFGPWMSRRGQRRCSNLVKNMLTQIFDAPFKKFWYTGKEEARPEGGIMKKCPKKSIAWISINLSNIMYSVLCAHSFGNNSYSHTPSTHVTAPGLSCRDVVRFEKSIPQNCEF